MAVGSGGIGAATLMALASFFHGFYLFVPRIAPPAGEIAGAPGVSPPAAEEEVEALMTSLAGGECSAVAAGAAEMRKGVALSADHEEAVESVTAQSSRQAPRPSDPLPALAKASAPPLAIFLENWPLLLLGALLEALALWLLARLLAGRRRATSPQRRVMPAPLLLAPTAATFHSETAYIQPRCPAMPAPLVTAPTLLLAAEGASAPAGHSETACPAPVPTVAQLAPGTPVGTMPAVPKLGGTACAVCAVCAELGGMALLPLRRLASAEADAAGGGATPPASVAAAAAEVAEATAAAAAAVADMEDVVAPARRRLSSGSRAGSVASGDADLAATASQRPRARRASAPAAPLALAALREAPQGNEAEDASDVAASDVGEEDEAVREAEAMLMERWVVEDPQSFAIFEDDEEERDYHRRRSFALVRFVEAYRASRCESEELRAGGERLLEDLERLQAESRSAVGEAAFWRSLARERGVGPVRFAADAI